MASTLNSNLILLILSHDLTPSPILFSLNSNLILLIQITGHPIPYKENSFKFQSDSINTNPDLSSGSLTRHFKFQSDSINTNLFWCKCQHSNQSLNSNLILLIPSMLLILSSTPFTLNSNLILLIQEQKHVKHYYRYTLNSNLILLIRL